MLRGCILSLLLYGALSIGYYRWLSTVFEPPESYWGSALVGFVVLCCIGAIVNAKNAYRDWSLIAASQRGLAPRDGRLIAVAGTIHPLAEPLIAPFSGIACVLCEYDLSRHGRLAGSDDRQNTGSDFAGFLMTPSVIRGALGEIKLLGFPVIDGFSETVHTSYGDARRAIDFLTTREFENRSGLKMVTLLAIFDDVWSDDDGHVEKNVRIGTVALPDVFPPALEAAIDRQLAADPALAAAAPADEGEEVGDDEEEDDQQNFDEYLDDEEDPDEDDWEPPPSVPKMTEKRVPIGTPVCAIGRYDELRRGLAPARGSTTPNRLVRGTADELAKKSRGAMSSYLIGGLVALVVVHAVTYGVMQAYLRSPELARFRETEAFAAVQRKDLPRLERLVQRGMEIDIRRSGGQTLLMTATDPAVAQWLIEQGADVNAVDENGQTALMLAASGGQTEVAGQLIAAKADLNRRSTNYDRTALMNAVDAGQDELAAMLRAAGALDDVVTAETGQPLPEQGAEQLAICKAYLAAIRARDPAALRDLFVGTSNYDFAEVDWDLWHRVRPVEIETWTGFARGDDATITLGGTSGSGHPCTWIYQLRREGAQWKIARESELYDDR